MEWPLASNSPARSSGLRPARTRSTICRRNSGEYGGRVLGIGSTSGERLRVSTKPGQSQSTPSRCTGVVAAACTQGKRTQHGKPQCVIRDDQPDAREGQTGRTGVSERPVVPLKPGNAGGGNGPQFKTDARRGEGPGD